MTIRNKPKRSAIYRGAAGRERAEEELANQKARAEARKEMGNQPFRFKVGVGESSQFIVCDDEPEVYRYEHGIYDKATKRSTYTGCVKEFDNCPVCEMADGKESYYAMYLTVIDLTPFTTRNGDEVEFSRKLMVIKPGQQKKFHRLYARAQKEGRTLRGMLIEASRDGDKDASIGSDFELIDYVEEDEMETYTRSWKDKENKKHSENCHEVFDYEELFGELDTESLRAIVGGAPAPGSRKHEEKELGRRQPARRSREAEEDDEGYQEASRKDRMRPRKQAAEEEEEEPPRRSSRGRREEPEEADTPRRPARGRKDAEAEEEEDTPRRPTARRSREAEPEEEPPRRSARGRREEPEEPEEDEEPPRRKAPGVGRRSTR